MKAWNINNCCTEKNQTKAKKALLNLYSHNSSIIKSKRQKASKVIACSIFLFLKNRSYLCGFSNAAKKQSLVKKYKCKVCGKVYTLKHKKEIIKELSIMRKRALLSSDILELLSMWNQDLKSSINSGLTLFSSFVRSTSIYAILAMPEKAGNEIYIRREILAAWSAEFWESEKVCACIGFENMQRRSSPKRHRMLVLTSLKWMSYTASSREKNRFYAITLVSKAVQKNHRLRTVFDKSSPKCSVVSKK